MMSLLNADIFPYRESHRRRIPGRCPISVSSAGVLAYLLSRRGSRNFSTEEVRKKILNVFFLCYTSLTMGKGVQKL